MKWISVDEQLPPKRPLLVMLEGCKIPHIVIYDYDEHGMPETCDKGNHMPGGLYAEITHWAELPSGPDIK